MEAGAAPEAAAGTGVVVARMGLGRDIEPVLVRTAGIVVDKWRAVNASLVPEERKPSSGMPETHTVTALWSP